MIMSGLWLFKDVDRDLRNDINALVLLLDFLELTLLRFRCDLQVRP